MKIAHVLSSLLLGGQERVALDLAAGETRRGHDVSVVSLAAPPEGPLGDAFRANGVAVHTLAKGPGVDASLPFRLAGHFRAFRIDVVHTHNPQPLFYGGLGARLARATLIHTKHGANPDRGLRLRLRQASGRLAHAYVAVSDTTADIARKNHECSAERLFVIENGINLERFAHLGAARDAARAELGLPADARVIGSVGRLAPEKNHVLLVRAALPLLSPTTRLVLIGDGPCAAELRSVAASAPDGRGRFIHFTGARDDVPRLLAALDIFALPSKTEGLPLVLPEAMACGLAVVATRVGGVPQVVIDHKTGFLVAADDESALRESLATLVDDPARARAMGDQGRKAAFTRYSGERMIDDYVALYAKAAQRNKGGAPL